MKKMIVILCALMLCACNPNNEEEEIPAIAGKTYYNTVDEFDNPEHSKIWFGKDGSFVMKDNFYDGYYEISGTWTVKENVATLDVAETGVGQFKTIIFEIVDDDTLKLKNTLAGSKSDDVFSTTEVKGDGSHSGNGDTKPDAAQIFHMQEGSYYLFHNSTQKTSVVSMVELIGIDTIIFQDRNDGSVNEFRGTFKEEDGYIVIASSTKEYPFPEKMVGERFLKISSKDTLIMEQDFPITSAGDIFSSGAAVYDGDRLKFKHEHTDMSDDMYLPTVEFYWGVRDTFTFTENLFNGMGEIYGWFEETDSAYVCHVEDAKALQGYAGADVTVIEFEKKDSNTLALKTDICLSQAGDVFNLEP